MRLFPWLAPWATFSRPSGADAHESYQQNVETPEPAFSRPCPLSSGHIQAGRHLGTNAEVAAWKGGSTEPLTWRTLSFGRSTRCSAVKWPALQLELGHYRETCLHRHLP